MIREKSLIKKALKTQMPDLEKVRKNCLEQRVQANILARKSWIIRAVPLTACAVVTLVVVLALSRKADDVLNTPVQLENNTQTSNQKEVTAAPESTTRTDIVINPLEEIDALRIDAKYESVDAKNWDISFVSKLTIPKDLTTISYFEVYTKPTTESGETLDSNSYSVLQNYTIIYSNDNGRELSMAFSKDFVPLRDYNFKGDTKTSTIGETSLIINQYEDSYMAQFKYDNMNFDIEAHGISEEEFITVLTSILS